MTVYVRFAPKADKYQRVSVSPLCATTGREHVQQGVCKTGAYPITSSARERKDSGIVSASNLAVLRFTISSNLVGS